MISTTLEGNQSPTTMSSEMHAGLPVLADVDVVVAGGGVSGCVAAVAAARTGAKTLLIEPNSFLGGTATAAMMTSIVASHEAGGVGMELIQRLAAAGAAPKWDGSAERSRSTPFDHESYKSIALEMIDEAGVDLWLYTTVLGPVGDTGTVRGVRVHSKGGEGVIKAKCVIDATGDADLAAQAGAETYKGREDDGKMRPFALLFRIGGLDLQRIYDWAQEHPDQIQPQFRRGQILEAGGLRVIARISGFYDLMDQAKRDGVIPEVLHYFRLEACWMERGIALCNTTRIYNVDGTSPRDLTRGEIEGRRQISALMQFVREYLPGGESAYLLDVAPRLGIRETRRIVGRRFVSDDDVYTDNKVPDPIATMGMWLPPRASGKAIDVHMPDPVEGSNLDLLERHPGQLEMQYHVLQLPYGVLVPKDIDGLLVTGRAISVNHRIDGHTRNQVIAMRMGEVAGTAAGMSAREGVPVGSVSYPALRAELAKGGMRDLDEPSVASKRRRVTE